MTVRKHFPIGGTMFFVFRMGLVKKFVTALVFLWVTIVLSLCVRCIMNLVLDLLVLLQC